MEKSVPVTCGMEKRPTQQMQLNEHQCLKAKLLPVFRVL